jgi:hypothetical protein
MMKLAATVVVLAATGASAADEESCAFDVKDLRPQFAKKQAKGFKLLSSKVDAKHRSVHEELQLPDTTKISLQLGGCAHVTWSLELKVPKISTKSVGAEIVATSRRVLPQLVMDKASIVDPARLIKALDDANIMQLPSHLPCGDATCELSVVLDEPKGKKKAPAKDKKDKEPETTEQPPEKAPVEEGPGVIRFTYDLPL